MADKYLRNVNGTIESVAAVVSSGGAADAGKAVALGNDGKLDITVMPDGLGQETRVLEAAETLDAGDFVNIFDDAGTTKVRKANATDTTKPANGFVKTGVAQGANATVYKEGQNDALTGLTIGTKYFLSTIGGQITPVAPNASGTIIQFINIATDTSLIRFEQGDFIKNA